MSFKQEYDDFGRGYWFCPNLDKKKDSGDTNGPDTEKRDPALAADANLISSLCHDGKHRPVLDIDIPVRLVPSSTPGHSHLYIDVPMEWGAYQFLLNALADAKILEHGYVEAALRRGATFLRPPGVKKPAEMLKEPAKFKQSKDSFMARFGPAKTVTQESLNPPVVGEVKPLGDPEGFGGSDF